MRTCCKEGSQTVARLRLSLTKPRLRVRISIREILCVIFTVLSNSHSSSADSSQSSKVDIKRIRAPDRTFLSSEAILADEILRYQNPVRKGSTPKQDFELLVVKKDRIDPLDHFRQYKGGYDVQSKHYLASTAFTGVYGYVIGFIWFVAGFVAIGCALNRESKKIEQMEKNQGELCTLAGRGCVTVMTMIVLAVLAVACCGAILAGNLHFHSTAKDIERTIIVGGAQNATKMISNVTSVMEEIKHDLAPYDDVAERLNTTTATLKEAAIRLLETVHNHKGTIDTAVKVFYTGIATIASANVPVCILGVAYVFVSRKQRRFTSWILVIAWVFIILNWNVFGLTVAVSSFADDTCEALREYQQSSRHTTLDTILPCNHLATGNKTMFRMRQKMQTATSQSSIVRTGSRQLKAPTTSYHTFAIPFQDLLITQLSIIVQAEQLKSPMSHSFSKL